MTICPICRWGGDVVKKGKRYNKKVTKQLYYCRACKRKFTPDDGFWKMKNTKETITEALDLYNSGLSLNKTSEHLYKHHNTKISARSILNWVKKYAKLLKDFTIKLIPQIKGRLHMDEIVTKVKKKKRYYWQAKDSKTKFKFSGNLTNRGYRKGAYPLFKQIKDRCYGQFLLRKKRIRFVTDGLEHYMRGYKKFFNRVALITHGVPIKAKRKKLKHNNNCMERENSRVKQRYKVMRGFKTNESGESILHFLDILYNFTYVPLNMKVTPAKAAGIKLNLKRNKLLSLIKIFEIYVSKSS
jgi:transposase-like protein